MEKAIFDMPVLAIAALIPMIIGFIWYNPKVFGKAWMEASGMTEEKVKSGNMGLIMGLSFVFSIMIGLLLANLAIHQNGIFSLFNGDAESTSALLGFLNENIPNWADNYRTFGHGSIHGFFAGLFMALPILATNAMFERKGFKYIAVNTGYWILTLTLMGGFICYFSGNLF